MPGSGWQGYPARFSTHSVCQSTQTTEPYCFKWLLCKPTPNSLNISQHFEGFDAEQWVPWSDFSVLVSFSSSKPSWWLPRKCEILNRSGLASHIAILSKIEIQCTHDLLADLPQTSWNKFLSWPLRKSTIIIWIIFPKLQGITDNSIDQNQTQSGTIRHRHHCTNSFLTS